MNKLANVADKMLFYNPNIRMISMFNPGVNVHEPGAMMIQTLSTVTDVEVVKLGIYLKKRRP